MATSSFYNSSGSTPAVQNSIQTAVEEAAGSATQAATSATEASTSATNAESSLNSFQRYYLGAYSSAPSTSQNGAMYFDTSTNQLYIWSGSSWDVTASANNLQDTDGLTEGSSNLYFTDERVDDRVNTLLTAGSNVTLTYDDAANTLTIASTATNSGGGASTFLDLTDTPATFTGQAYRYLMVNSTEDGIATVTPSTDDVSEGTTNLYYTDARADARIAAAGHITASSTDTLTNKSGNISQWTNDSGYLTSAGSLYDLSNVNTSASPSDGQVLAWDNANSYWTPVAASSGGGGISLTDLSATTGAAGTAALSYNSTTGVFTLTPPDLSSYLTSATLTGSDLDMGGNKVLFGNMYSAEIDLPSATTYHGMFAHVHGTGKGYFAHNGNWVKLIDETSSTTDNLTEGSTNLYYTDARADARIAAADLADLNDVNNTAPTDGQVLTWDNANSYWKPADAASGGGSSIDYAAHGTDADSSGSPTANADNSLALGYGAEATAAYSVSIGNKSKATGAGAIRIGYDSNSTGLPASGTAAIGLGYNANPSANQAISIGYSSNATQSYSIGIGVNTTADQSKSVALGYYANTDAANQLMLGGTGSTNGFTSIRVGNTTYSPSNDMDLATKKYVDDNAGGGGSSNIVTGTFTTTSTTYVDAGEIVDTDDGFTGALDIVLHATTGTGTSMQTTTMRILFSFNSGNPSYSNWTTFPTIGNGASFSGQIAYSGFRWDTSTNKIYLQVKNKTTASTVYKWTAVLV